MRIILIVLVAALAWMSFGFFPFPGPGRPPSGPPSNQAPIVDAGGPYETEEGVAIQLVASASDDGLPNPPGALTQKWTDDCVGAVTYTPNEFALNPTVSLAAMETCTLTLSVCDDGEAACQ